MTEILAARLQMAASLAFHIIFAIVGIALPLMMVVAEAAWIRTGDPVYRVLARMWAKGAAILFAVGAVSGTVLSFELGLLWPRFMGFAGAIIGLPFALEGFAFFTEAIFLGIYLYAWDRLNPKAHLAAGWVVAVSGLASAIFVVLTNAWMNTPVGFRVVDGKPVDIRPIAVFFSPAALAETLHMGLAAYAATGLAVAGVHAYFLRIDRTNAFHRKALGIALAVGGFAAVVQPLSGHYAGHVVAETQPVKLASMEGQFQTERWAPLRIGGFPDMAARKTRFALEIPGGLSFIAYNRFDAQVLGLDHFPEDQWPVVPVVHMAFQVMVGCGMAMMGVALWAAWTYGRTRRLPDGRLFFLAVMLVSPLGMIAVEAGWVVTEVGRQPWIIHGVMRTSEAATQARGLWASLLVYTSLYVMLAAIVAKLMIGLFRSSPDMARVEEAA